MKGLYLDTCDFLCIGILDSENKFIDYLQVQDKKSSSLMHNEVFELLKKNKLEINDLEFLIFSSGPGSYTGVRLAEGAAQVLGWKIEKVSTFYHFEVPYLLGVAEGEFVTNAHKGEYFIYDWKEGSSNVSLVDKKNFENRNFYSIGENLDGEKSHSTANLIKENSQELFSKVVERGEWLEPYYYRTIEKEFNKPKNPFK